MFTSLFVLMPFIIIFLSVTLLVSTKIAMILFFAFDKTILFISSWIFFHMFVTTKVSSGNAIWFWDILISIIIVSIYSILFKKFHDRFDIPGKIINFIISFIGTYLLYSFITYFFVMHEKTDMLPLLNNSIANVIVNFIVIIFLSYIAYIRRENLLRELEK